MALAQEKLDFAREQVRDDTPLWARKFGYIVTKSGEKVLIRPKAGQLAFDAELEAQRKAGQPMRAIVLKARQVGISTWTQAKLIQRATQREHYNTVVVAHDRETGGKLYKIGETFYANLPDWLRPAISSHRRARFLHFAEGGKEAWSRGEAWPDSTYLVDTAGEFQSGRGGTYQAVHASEVAFWDAIGEKLTALKNAVPRHPESLFVIESTANGLNEFKDIWDDAAAGRSSYIPFFWPWWKEPEYRLRFMNDAEAEAFIVGDPSNPWSEEEADLVKNFDLTLEQLNWRRRCIADECNGDVRTFHQEYPSTAEEAFLSTGQRVFDPYLVKAVLISVGITDPMRPTPETPGPLRGTFKAGRTIEKPARGGTVQVPLDPKWEPRRPGERDGAEWSLWLPEPEGEETQEEALRKRHYVLAADVSGGEIEDGGDEPAYHAIEIIDHETLEQVGHYRSRIDPDLLATEIYLVATFFNNAWVGVERTGSWGLPVLRRLWWDFRYPFLYRSRKVGTTSEKQEDRLGWDTNQRTKPMLLEGTTTLLREGTHGLRSRVVAEEMGTYIRLDNGKTKPEPGKFSDCLMAWMIAQQIARELPVRDHKSLSGKPRSFLPRGSLGGYDPRFRR